MAHRERGKERREGGRGEVCVGKENETRLPSPSSSKGHFLPLSSPPPTFPSPPAFKSHFVGGDSHEVGLEGGREHRRTERKKVFLPRRRRKFPHARPLSHPQAGEQSVAISAAAAAAASASHKRSGLDSLG